MKTFVARSLSAIVFAVIMLGGICWNQWSFTILFFIINAGALWEYYGLMKPFYSTGKISAGIYQIIGVILGSLVYYFLFISNDVDLSFVKFFSFVFFIFVFFILELYSKSERGISNAAVNVMGLIYVSVPLGLLHYLIPEDSLVWFPNRVQIVLGIVLMIWANDTFAYIGGSLLGKHKLFPSISPKKSWEGFFVGIVGSVVVAIILSIYFKNLQLQNWIIISIIVSVTGTLGDLFESLLKRNAGVKDSGSIMPGHGGFLDRFDAFIFCIPFVYTYIIVLQILK